MDNLAILYSAEPVPFVDTDSDSIDDNWEMQYFHSLTNANASTDSEPDGFLDLFEYKAGTDPTNALSGLFIDNFAKGGVPNEFVVTWQSVDGKTYRVVSAPNLQYGPWTTNVSGIAATAPENTETVSSAADATFFGIELEE